MKKVSIIIPVYNAEKYLNRCLDSVLNQDYDNIEIIVINDGSIDNTTKILEKYSNSNKNIIIYNNENKGVSYSRNFGIDKSTGQYITFVDADDWLERNAISTIVDIMEKEELDILRTNYFKDSSDSCKKAKEYENQNIADFLNSIILGKIPAYVWTIMINRSCLNNIKFDEDIFMMEDTVFYAKLLINKKYKFSIRNIYAYHYWNNIESASRNSNYIPRVLNILKVEKKLKELLGNEYYNKVDLGIVNATVAEFKKISENGYYFFSETLSRLEKDEVYNLFFLNVRKVKLNKKSSIIANNIHNHIFIYLIIRLLKIYKKL